MMSGHGLMWSNMYGPDKPKVRKRIEWRRIGALFAPYFKEQSLVFGCIVISALLGLLPGYMTARIIDSAIPHKSLRELTTYVAIILGTALLSMAFGVLQGYLNSLVGEGIMRDIRTSLVAHLHKMPLSFFSGTKTGEIMNRVSSDVDNVDNVVTGTLTAIITNVVMILTTLVAMFVWNWRLALISLIVVPFMVLPLGPVGRRMYEIRKKTREQRDTIESITQETLSISGITLIKSFAREAFEKSRFYDVGTQLMNLEIRLAMVGRWFIASVTAMVIVGPAIVWIGGGWLAVQGLLDVGVIVAFIGYIQGRLYGPAAALVGVQVQVVSALAVFERIFDYLDMATEEYTPSGALQLRELRGDIEFDRVTFGYNSDRTILDNVSFHIDPGQLAAFVGPSGAGKSTITQLVPRFYDPQSGRVLIDGHDVKSLTLDSLRRDIGIVTQETYLFHDTIASNLRYAKTDATDEELIAASKSANIHDFIASLSDGYATVVGERGHKLSGGERQRLAIARVLLKNPSILILDEATSALDSHNEAAIQSALEVVMRGRTSLVIAHRLSTIRAADIIFAIENGRIAESGTHDALLAQGGVYAHLYRTQFRDAALEV
ncbi:MAG: ABC transporter ATP-binding protein/permease [Candidatus Eremiobacteraeota bacterium]|nr:ABC transporter ATP-binding protein/permease [Candidatus Eremiobacteraeota bacterium]